MKTRIAILFLLALPLYAADEMRKLDWWIGDWKGDAAVQMGPGKTERASQTERVSSHAGGRVLVIEGTGRRKLEDGGFGEVVHDALAVVSWDESSKSYRFDAWTAREGYVKAWLEAGDDHTAKWGFDTPQGGKIRYTIRLTDAGEWHEVGEFSRDGNQWMKFFEMKLKKT
jgi:hypothetical protein